jgi:hypothetical protein
MKTIAHALFLLVFASGGFSADQVRMKELTNPLAIDADNDQIYVTEKASVFIPGGILNLKRNSVEKEKVPENLESEAIAP